MNKRTIALSGDQYDEIIITIRSGFNGCRGNNRIATCLVLEANLGLRISDILKLKFSNIVRDGERFRLDIIEQKTKKNRTFTVPKEVYNFIKTYCAENGIASDEIIFPITERAVQKHLKNVCEHLHSGGCISTHSFRKFFATQIYINNDYNIILVQQLLQHSSPIITQNYIGIQSKLLELALEKHICLK